MSATSPAANCSHAEDNKLQSRHLRGTIGQVVPGVAHQVILDLTPGAEARFLMEPPAFMLHMGRPGTGLISHTAYVGAFEGPYPFSLGKE